MTITTASLTAVVTATTGGVTLADKTTLLLSGLHDAIVKELCSKVPLTMGQSAHAAALRAELVDNAADFVTALTVA